MKSKSFTLIELLVVIVIIGILAGVIIVSTSSSINKANLAKAQSFSNTVQNELLLNLVSEWTFNEDSGTTAKDTWGNNDGTFINANYVQKSENRCVYGGCYSFNGTDNYIEISNSTTLKNKNFTISLWFNANSLSSLKYLIGNGQDYNNAKGFGIMTYYSSSLNFWVGSDSLNRANSIYVPIEPNKWYFVVAIYEEGVGSKLYLNNSFGTSNSFVGSIVYDTKVFTLGKLRDNYYFFDGLIDDVRVYNAPLTTAQIKQEYIAGLNSLLANNNISKEEYNQRLESLSINY